MGEVSELSEIDQFMIRMMNVPSYKERLQSMLLKATFHEKSSELEKV